MTVGESIFKLRKSHGLSQEELATKMLVSRQTVSLWEKGETLPTIDNLMRLKEIFGVTVDKVLCCEEEKTAKINADSLDTVCGALAYAMGIAPPKLAAEKNRELVNYIDKVFDGQKADRILMYNPDAIAEWVYEKYPEYFAGVKAHTDKEIYLSSVMPSVTPVCFATMYTGVQPAVHGIQKYEKPVVAVESIFDALLAAGKKPALVTYRQCSLSRIFLERNMDYFHFEEGDIAEVNAKAAELIIRDEHDFIVVYNGNYDAAMHKNSPESARALGELRINDHMFASLSYQVQKHWRRHNALVGFAMDHGCHEIDGNCGSHGLDMPEDLNIVHLYKGYPGKEEA